MDLAVCVTSPIRWCIILHWWDFTGNGIFPPNTKAILDSVCGANGESATHRQDLTVLERLFSTRHLPLLTHTESPPAFVGFCLNEPKAEKAVVIATTKAPPESQKLQFSYT